MFRLWLQAGFWGLVAGSALLIGAAIGYFLKVPLRVIDAIMAFGSGILISALVFVLKNDVYKQGDFGFTAIGFISGAVVYTLSSLILDKNDAKHRKRADNKQPSEDEQSGNGLALAIGALLDGFPESIVIGVFMIHGGAVSFITIVAIYLANSP